MSWDHSGSLFNIVDFSSGKDNLGNDVYLYLKDDSGATTLYLTADVEQWQLFNEHQNNSTGISGAPISCTSAKDGLFFLHTDSQKVYALTVGSGGSTCNAIELAGNHDLFTVKSDGDEQLIMCYKNGKIKTRSGDAQANLITERIDLSTVYDAGTYAIDVAKADDGWCIISLNDNFEFKTLIASPDWTSIYKDNKINMPLSAKEVNYYEEEDAWKASDGSSIASTTDLSDWYRSGASMWIAVGRDGHLAYSSDGLSWTYSAITQFSTSGANMASSLIYTESASGQESAWVMSNGWNALEVAYDQDPTDGSAWSTINLPGHYAARDMAYSKGTKTLVICGDYSHVFRSTDFGQTWTMIEDASESSVSTSPSIASNGQNGWVMSEGMKIWMSTDDGLTWTHTDTLSVAPDNLIWSGTHYIALSSGSIKRSADGITWLDASTGAGTVSHAASNGSTIIAAGSWGSLYRSVDHGDTWTQLNSAIGLSMNTVATDGEKWLVGGNSGKIQISTDDGATWQEVADDVFDGSGHWVSNIVSNFEW